MEYRDDKIWCGLTNDKLDINELSEWCENEEAGCVVIFKGTTRNNHNSREVIKLSYECYHEMALNEMKNICNELIKQYDQIKRISFYHRLNDVPVKETSVVCCISSEHRHHGFLACGQALIELKQRVPIWKKEIYKDETTEWKENVEFHNIV